LEGSEDSRTLVESVAKRSDSIAGSDGIAEVIYSIQNMQILFVQFIKTVISH